MTIKIQTLNAISSALRNTFVNFALEIVYEELVEALPVLKLFPFQTALILFRLEQ